MRQGLWLYDKDGTRLGVIDTMESSVRETLNGDDRLTISCLYDESGIWKWIRPGAMIGVTIPRNVPTDAGIDDVVQDDYYTISEFIETALEVYRFSGDTARVGVARVDRRVTVNYYRPDVNRYRLDSVVCYNGQTYTDAWIKPEGIEMRRAYRAHTIPGTDMALKEEKYVIVNVVLDSEMITVEAVQESIYVGDGLIYRYEGDEAGQNYLQPNIFGTIVANYNMKIHSLNIVEDGIIIDNRFNAFIFYNDSGTACTLNELVGTHLRQFIEYDVLRTGAGVYLQERLGRDRGVVLAVGLNLNSMRVEFNGLEAGYHALSAFAVAPETGQVVAAQSADIDALPVDVKYSRIYAFKDDGAQKILDDSKSVPLARSRLNVAVRNVDFDSVGVKGDGDFEIILTPEVAQFDSGVHDMIVLGDTVTIVDPRLPGGQLKRRVVEITRDPVKGFITELTVGDLPKTVYDVVRKIAMK